MDNQTISVLCILLIIIFYILVCYLEKRIKNTNLYIQGYNGASESLREHRRIFGKEKAAELAQAMYNESLSDLEENNYTKGFQEACILYGAKEIK